MDIDDHTFPWLEGVYGTQVLPLINLDDEIIRVEAGPGTGKTFGLVRRVQRILHPRGLNVPGDKVLIVAFNRVIAKQLKTDIEKRLIDSPHNGEPIIQSVHSLCLQVIKSNLRILLPHEQEAMLYDVRTQFPALRQKYETVKKTDQSLRDHIAKHTNDIQLWQAVERWLTRHQAILISDLPSLLLDRLDGGDYGDKRYSHIIVDEYQDLTPGEQKLFLKLREEDGKFVALGDPRQSIYKFRGNDKEGLSKIENLITSEESITDIFMTECHRCPEEIVHASNQLMDLYESHEMTSSSKTKPNIHVVVWKSLEAEILGMAKSIVDNIHKHPQDPDLEHVCHLALVTRRQFGYMLREKIHDLDPDLNVDLTFTESLLETWILREAFLFFCLLVDPDAPTWRAWFSYQNSQDGKDFKAPERNSDAYLKFLTACNDNITDEYVHQLATNPQKPPGKGRNNLYDRAKRYVYLKSQLQWDGENPIDLLKEIFDSSRWGIDQYTDDKNTIILDMELLYNKSSDSYTELAEKNTDKSDLEILRNVARRLRYQIATRESFIPDETSDLQICTLWGAKGITSDHVYLIGLCNEAIPGKRRSEYPGTDLDYEEEQRRLFYVSITRPKKSLILSRAKSISKTQALRIGLQFRDDYDFWVPLGMTKFLRDIIDYLPFFQDGESWEGC